MIINKEGILSGIIKLQTLEDPMLQSKLWNKSTIRSFFRSVLKNPFQLSRRNFLSSEDITYMKARGNRRKSKLPFQKTILVAEDDDFNYSLIKACLKSKNFDLLHAKNGAEAVRIHKSNKDISLILMDIQMPVMDGITATKKIRQIDKSVPVIAQTAYALDNIESIALEAGCSDFITKPLKIDLLTKKIKKHIR